MRGCWRLKGRCKVQTFRVELQNDGFKFIRETFYPCMAVLVKSVELHSIYMNKYRLPLSQWFICNSLALFHLRWTANGVQWVWMEVWISLNMMSIMLIRLIQRNISDPSSLCRTISILLSRLKSSNKNHSQMVSHNIHRHGSLVYPSW